MKDFIKETDIEVFTIKFSKYYERIKNPRPREIDQQMVFYDSKKSPLL